MVGAEGPAASGGERVRRGHAHGNPIIISGPCPLKRSAAANAPLPLPREFFEMIRLSPFFLAAFRGFVGDPGVPRREVGGWSGAGVERGCSTFQVKCG